MIRDAQKLEETLIWSNYNRPTAERTFYVSAHARKLFVHWVNLIWHKMGWHKFYQKDQEITQAGPDRLLSFRSTGHSTRE